jgi:uncharacterized protein involved in type VI secretion and phage assembly
MNLDSSYLERVPGGPGGPFYGVYPALVLNIVDPDQQGRVKVRLPWAPDGKDSSYEAWARLATLMAGNNRGTWFVPEVNDEVLVAFEGGNPRCPYIIGALWNGKDAPPEKMDGAGNNNLKTIRSHQGVCITLDDTVGAVKLRLETPNGQSIVLNDADNSLLVEDSSGNSVKLDAGGITVIATSDISLSASSAKIEASEVTVNAIMTRFSGMVRCGTLITDAVISSVYTPGTGNIW